VHSFGFFENNQKLLNYCMDQLIGKTSKIKPFAAGFIFGTAFYAVYLWLGKDGDCYLWLASDQMFGTTFGSIFFPIQYFIFSFGDFGTFPDGTTITICFCLVGLLYGYIFLSFRLFPKLAIVTFVISILSFLFCMVAFVNSTSPILGILIWPVIKFSGFATAAQFSSGPIVLMADCCITGLWYSGIVCGIWTLIYRPITKSKFEAPAFAPAWFVGKCTNTTMGASANLLLIIHGVSSGKIYGELGLSGDLVGSGSFEGKVTGADIVFSTCVPAEQVVIEWLGQIAHGQIRGTYSARTSHPDLLASGHQFQNGIWECLFSRIIGNPDPAGIDEVYIYNDGSAEGPFTVRQFEQLTLESRWPAKAIVALKDRTCWTSVGEYIGSKTTDRVS
jgi:hypothetical protein